MNLITITPPTNLQLSVSLPVKMEPVLPLTTAAVLLGTLETGVRIRW